jgi:hypothetical protein
LNDNTRRCRKQLSVVKYGRLREDAWSSLVRVGEIDDERSPCNDERSVIREDSASGLGASRLTCRWFTPDDGDGTPEAKLIGRLGERERTG